MCCVCLLHTKLSVMNPQKRGDKGNLMTWYLKIKTYQNKMSFSKMWWPKQGTLEFQVFQTKIDCVCVCVCVCARMPFLNGHFYQYIVLNPIWSGTGGQEEGPGRDHLQLSHLLWFGKNRYFLDLSLALTIIFPEKMQSKSKYKQAVIECPIWLDL